MSGSKQAMFDLIQSKRDARAYARRPIPEATLRRILRAGRKAGSAKHAQPVRFVLLRDRERRRELAACGDFTAHLPDAAVAVALVTLPPSGQWDAERAMSFDAGRAAQNMMLAAWSEGITSCPVTMHRHEDAARVLDLPPEHRVTWVLCFGYPAEQEPERPARTRLPLAEYVHEDRWNGGRR